MYFKEYVELLEGDDSFIEDYLTSFILDLKDSKGDAEEQKDIVKSIFRYITNNVLKVGRVASDRLIKKDVATKLKAVMGIAEKIGVDVPANVEERILASLEGKEVDSTFDNDEQIKKERAEKAKSKKEDDDAEKDDKEGKERLSDEKIKTIASKDNKEKKVKLVSDDELDNYLKRKTHRK